jgi:hypothetical protein
MPATKGEPKPKREPKPKPPPDPDKLARESAGSYRTGDERFLVRQDHGGKWYVTDTEQTNELGLELVLGPFATIAEAKAALSVQREHPAGASPGAKVRSLTPGDRMRSKSTDSPGREPKATSKRGVTPKPEPEPEPETEPEPEPRPEPEPEPEPEPPATDYRPAKRRPTGDDRDAVVDTVRTINDAWTSGRPELMRDALDPDVVFVQPGFAARTEGRDAAIESYREFATSAVVHAYEETELSVDVRGHTAVASYRFEIDYEMKGKRLVETGHDLFVFDRFGTRWRAVWRLVIQDPAEGS